MIRTRSAPLVDEEFAVKEGKTHAIDNLRLDVLSLVLDVDLDTTPVRRVVLPRQTLRRSPRGRVIYICWEMNIVFFCVAE